jgi:hypothetical protein
MQSQAEITSKPGTDPGIFDRGDPNLMIEVFKSNFSETAF